MSHDDPPKTEDTEKPRPTSSSATLTPVQPSHRRVHMRLARLLGCAFGLVVTSCFSAGSGVVEVRGTTLGDTVLRADRCRFRPDIQAFDFEQDGGPLTVRVVARNPDPSTWQLVIANRAGPAGPAEVVVSPASCRVLSGYVHRYFGDVSLGVRLDCQLPGGGAVRGLLGDGRCRS